MENNEGKARGEQKKWKLRGKIKMRGGNVAGGHESEGCKEREGVGRRWDTLRARREAELERRGMPCQAHPCFCRMDPMRAASDPVPFPTLSAFPLSVNLELYGVGMVHAINPLSFQKSFLWKVLKKKISSKRRRITV